MISVLPCNEKERVAALYAEESLPFSAESCAVIAREGTRELGYCLFDFKKDRVMVRSLRPQSDLALADGILRSALHVAICRGVIQAFYAPDAPEKLFLKLGFVENADKRTLDITKLFKKCAGCSKNA